MNLGRKKMTALAIHSDKQIKGVISEWGHALREFTHGLNILGVISRQPGRSNKGSALAIDFVSANAAKRFDPDTMPKGLRQILKKTPIVVLAEGYTILHPAGVQ
jgi:hypothetical protein